MLTVLIGPPACGKTRWAARATGEHLQTDALRVVVTGTVQDHTRDDEVASAFDRAVVAALRRGATIVVENGANARRTSYLAVAREVGLPAHAVVFENYGEALANALRRPIPDLTRERWEALAGEARAAAATVDDEGWDEVRRISP